MLFMFYHFLEFTTLTLINQSKQNKDSCNKIDCSMLMKYNRQILLLSSIRTRGVCKSPGLEVDRFIGGTRSECRIADRSLNELANRPVDGVTRHGATRNAALRMKHARSTVALAPYIIMKNLFGMFF